MSRQTLICGSRQTASSIMAKANEMSGAEPRMGLKLYSVFIAAGLPAPTQPESVPLAGLESRFG